MTVLERIKHLCHEYNITPAYIERELGFANGYIGKIKDETVTYARLQKIADLLRVTPQYLFTGDTTRTKLLREDEQDLLAAYNKLNLHARMKALENIEDMTLLDKYAKKLSDSAVAI